MGEHGEFDPGQAFSLPREEFGQELLTDRSTVDRVVGLTELQSGNADYVVRSYSRNTTEGQVAYSYPPEIDTEQAKYDYLLSVAESDAEEFDLLRQSGVAVPPTFFTVGRDDRADMELDIFIATRKVEGTALPEVLASLNEPDPVLAEQVVGLFRGLVDYYAGALVSGDPYLRDIAAFRQYKLGAWEPGQSDQIWLVDTDPIINHPDPAKPKGYWLAFIMGDQEGKRGVVPRLGHMLEQSRLLMDEEQEVEVEALIDDLEAACFKVLRSLDAERKAA